MTTQAWKILLYFHTSGTSVKYLNSYISFFNGRRKNVPVIFMRTQKWLREDSLPPKEGK